MIKLKSYQIAVTVKLGWSRKVSAQALGFPYTYLIQFMKSQVIPTSVSCHPHHSLNLVLWLHHSPLCWAIIIHTLPDQNYGQQRLCPNSISNRNVHRAKMIREWIFAAKFQQVETVCLAMASLVFYVIFNCSLFILNLPFLYKYPIWTLK